MKLSGPNVQFVTGDPLIDKWERELAEGAEPNLDEFFTEEENAQWRAVAEQLAEDPQGINDEYAASQGDSPPPGDEPSPTTLTTLTK